MCIHAPHTAWTLWAKGVRGVVHVSVVYYHFVRSVCAPAVVHCTGFFCSQLRLQVCVRFTVIHIWHQNQSQIPRATFSHGVLGAFFCFAFYNDNRHLWPNSTRNPYPYSAVDLGFRSSHLLLCTGNRIVGPMPTYVEAIILDPRRTNFPI